MSEYDYTGAIFKNDKGENEARPDYKGSALIGGKKYWVSAWIKKSGDKPPFLSMTFQEADAPEDEKPQAKSKGAPKKPAKSGDSFP